MVIYIINILSLFIWQYVYKKYNNKKDIKKIIIMGIVIQFSLLQGLRNFSIGSDTAKYVEYYDIISKNLGTTLYQWYAVENLNMEIAWVILIKLCGILHMPAQMFLILVALIINGLLGLFIYRTSDDVILSFWLFICFEFFTLSFTMLRQMIAIMMVANSFVSLLHKDKKQFILWNIGAILFHKTAIIFIIMYPLYWIIEKLSETKLNKMKYPVIFKTSVFVLILIGCSLIFSKLFIIVAKALYSNYTFTKSELGGLWILMVCIYLLTLFTEYFQKKCDRKLLLFQLFALICVSLQFCTIYISQIFRATYYFYIFGIIAIPYCFKLLNKMKHIKMYRVILLALTFAQYVLFSMNIYQLVPYRFCF